MIRLLLLQISLAAPGQATPAAELSTLQPDVRCGGYCLQVALEALGLGDDDFESLEKSLGPPPSTGYSLAQLDAEAIRRGAKTLMVETSTEALKGRDPGFVCIAALKPGHFVIVYGISENHVDLMDFPKTSRVDRATFESLLWTKRALLLSTTELAPYSGSGTIRMVGFVLAGLLLLAVAAFPILKRRRRPAALATGLLQVALLSSGCSPRGVVTEDPDLPDGTDVSVVPASVDLGRVFRSDTNQSVETRFRLVNDGPRPVEILDTVVGCDCTGVRYDSRTIPAKGSTDATVSIRLGDSAVTRSTTIKIHTSRTSSKPTAFRVDWTVVHPLATERDAVDFLNVPIDEPKRFDEPIHLNNIVLCKRCKIACDYNKELLTVEGGIGDSFPRGESHDAPAGGTGRELLMVTLLPQKTADRYSATLSMSLECGGEVRSRYLLPITWSVAPILGASPAGMFLGIHRAGVDFERTIVLRSAPGEKFHVTSVQPTGAGRVVSWLSSPDDDVTKMLTLTFSPPTETGPYNCPVSIKTTHGRPADVSVTLTGVVSDSATKP